MTLSIPLPKPAAGVSGPPIYEIKLSYLPPESILAWDFSLLSTGSISKTVIE